MDSSSSLMMALGVLFLASCGQEEGPTAPAVVADETSGVSDAALDAEISQALAPKPEPSSILGSGAAAVVLLEDQVAAIRRKHPGKNAAELLNVPEVNENLVAALKELSESPKLKAQMDASVEVAASFIGLDESGSYKVNLDMANYSDDRTDRMLQAVMSGRAASIVEYVVGEVGEAAPDLSYGGLQRAPNGIAIEPAPPEQDTQK